MKINFEKLKSLILLFAFLAIAIFLLFTNADKNWAVVSIVIAFLIGANAIDKRQKEYLNGRIGKLEKRIDKLEHK